MYGAGVKCSVNVSVYLVQLRWYVAVLQSKYSSVRAIFVVNLFLHLGMVQNAANKREAHRFYYSLYLTDGFVL